MARYYDLITKDKLTSLILEKDEEGDFVYKDTDDYFVFDYCKKVKKDLEKIIFDFENVYYPHDSTTNEKFLGIQQIGDFTFYGCWAGGDWEFPVYFILYWDGKNVRGYIPEKGNTFDTKWRTAYGSQDNRENWTGTQEDTQPKKSPIPNFDLMISDILQRIKPK